MPKHVRGGEKKQFPVYTRNRIESEKCDDKKKNSNVISWDGKYFRILDDNVPRRFNDNST